jgi:hypothetical protein
MVSAQQMQHTLIVNSGPNIGQSYILNDVVSTLGRSADNTIVLDSTQVSRYHTKITLLPTGAVIEDTGSTNGTFLNGQRITSQYPLTSGDVIGIADYVTYQYILEGTTGVGTSIPSTYDGATKIMGGQSSYSSPQAPAPQYESYAPEFQQASYVPPTTSYPSVQPAVTEENTRNPTTLYVIIAILVVLICFCVAVAIFLWFAPEAFWRDIFDFFGIPWPSMLACYIYN